VGEPKDDQWRRQEDKEWLSSVDHQLVTLMASQKILNDEIDQVKEKLEDLHDFLRGGLDGRDPIETRLRDTERAVQKYDVILHGGPLGDGGLIKIVEHISSGEQAKTTRRGQTLSLLGSIVAALFAIGSVLLSNWSHILASFREPPAVTRTVKRRVVHRRIVVKPEPVDERDDADVPEGSGADASH
jgi:hypothetical protein